MQNRRQLETLAQLIEAAVDEFEGDGVYVISVASRLADMHPNTLRKYENAGLLNPDRTIGRQRLYSNEDIERLKIIRRLIDRYNLTTQALRLLTDMVKTLKSVANYLETDPAFEYNKSASKLANYIGHKLRSANLD